MKKFKCENCGSSQYVQSKKGVYICEYCGAKFNIGNKDEEALSDLQTTKNSKIRYVEANISEDEFYKKALMHLSINKHAPKNILDSKFDYVGHRFVFFAIFDVDYYSENYYNNESDNQNIATVSPKKQSYIVASKNMCVKLTQDCPTEQAAVVFDSYLDFYEVSKSKTTFLKSSEITYPSKEEVYEIVTNATDDYRDKEIVWSKDYAELKKSKYNQITYKINNLEILAVPEYYLEYAYLDQKYRLSSFADELNIFGNVPKISDLEDKKEEKLKKLSIFNITVASLIILFSLFNLFIFRSIRLVPVDAILCGVAVLLLIASKLISRKITKELNNEWFELKKEIFFDFAKMKNIEITSEDEDYISLLKGGY